MQTRLTMRSRGGRTHDVEVNAPMGTSLGEVAAMLQAASGGVRNVGVPSSFWSGSRTIRDGERLGGPGLRSGCVLGVDEPAPRASRTHGAIRLQVVGGPDAGRVEPVARGQLRIGRGPDCEVQLTDPDVSRHHAELCVTPSGITVRDLGSTNGTRILGAAGTPTTVEATGRSLPLDTYLTLGDTTLCVAGINTPPASMTAGSDGRLLVNRPPRLDLPPPERVDLAALPTLAKRGSVPWVAALVPAVGGVGLAWFLHSPQFLAFALLSPVVLLATSVGDRLGGRRGRRRARASRRDQLGAATEAAAAMAHAETAFRRRSHPDPAAVLGMAVTPDARLWERRREDEDFLDIRLGLGTFASRVRIHRGNELLPPSNLAGVPAVVSLRDGPLGICGPRALSLRLARWVIGQLVVLHSPADLRLMALLADDAGSEWEFLRWLPHIRDGEVGVPRIACTAQNRKRLAAEVCADIEPVEGSPARREVARSLWTVVLVDKCASTAELARLQGLLGRGPQASLTAVFLDDDARRLPPICSRTARMAGETGSRVVVHTRLDPSGDNGSPPEAQSQAAAPVADQVTSAWCDRVARGLAPLHDPGAQHTSGLPSDVRARDLFGLDDLSPAAILERWSRAEGRAFTPLAMGPEGPLDIDLGRDGPHVLIAGTTGAGKSELLQTLVAGLAVHASPRDVQFVLIDYKGGAAFGVCSRLPHTAGLVTDLDGHLTERALQSLDAELRRRETLFAAAEVAELATYQRSPAKLEPLGRLVLVVDEFAALAEELPEFVSGLVGIAQRGRSLGVHLILATQRPGGVVSPEIRANTALRIALRVTDPAESSDVIDSELAARIDQHLPGRAVVRSGQSLTQVQVGRVSVPVADAGPDIDVVALDRWGGRVRGFERPRAEQRTDLDAIVAALKVAADTQHPGTGPRRPWLDPLPPAFNLASLPAPATATAIVLGMTDRPAQQAQSPFLLDLAEPRTLVLTGGPRSGRTSALRAAGMRAADRIAVDDLHIYAIDCAGGGLRWLADLPHCGAVVSRDAPTSIRALISRLALELGRRQESASTSADGRSPSHRSGPRDVTASPVSFASDAAPALLVLLDGWEGFLAAVEDLDAGRTVDDFLHLLRDGAGSGFTVLIAGDRATLTARLASAVQRRFVLRMSDPADYAIAGLTRGQIPASMPPGRMIDTADASQTQLGTFDPDGSDTERNELERLIAGCRERDAVNPAHRRPFSVRALPRLVRLADLPPPSDPGQIVLGVGGDSGALISIDPSLGRSAGLDVRFLVAGPPRSGRSTVLRLILAQLARRQPGHVLVAAGPRSPLAAAAQVLTVPFVDPAGGSPDGDIVDTLLTAGQPLCLLIDDCDLFAESSAGERLSALVRQSPPGLDVFAAGRTDDLALTFRGVAADVKRARVGLLLQPGPGDGELFGVRLPYQRAVSPVGRGLLIAADLLPADRWNDEATTGPVSIQVAQP